MTHDLIGKYISEKLFEELYERGLQLITKAKKNMKNRLVKLNDTTWKVADYFNQHQIVGNTNSLLAMARNNRLWSQLSEFYQL